MKTDNHLKSRSVIPIALLAFSLLLSGCALNPFYRAGADAKVKEQPQKVVTTNSKRAPDRTRCGLTPDPGRCRAAFKRFYFDTRAAKCRQFTWGGCGGTVPFKTLADCKADCEF